jgi:hypothetical protein
MVEQRPVKALVAGSSPAPGADIFRNCDIVFFRVFLSKKGYAVNRERVSEYLEEHARKADLLQEMWNDPYVQCYNDEKLPLFGDVEMDSVFLAGPTSRRQLIEYNWRCEAVTLLRQLGFKGYIFVPEPRGREKRGDFTERSYIHWWESNRLLSATHPAFWIPREFEELMGLNTNFELGMFIGRSLFSNEHRQLFIGWPPEAERMGLPRHYAIERAACQVQHSLHGLCSAIVGTEIDIPT